MQKTPELEHAYRDTHYWIRGVQDPFEVRIDQRSDALARLQQQHGVASTGFITAWNPHSERCDRARNDAAQATLGAELRRRGYRVLEGEGVASDGGWAEANHVVLGIDERTLADLGREHGQKAVLYSGPDAVPRLIWLER